MVNDSKMRDKYFFIILLAGTNLLSLFYVTNSLIIEDIATKRIPASEHCTHIVDVGPSFLQ